MGNIGGAFILALMALSIIIDMTFGRWRCEANGYSVQGVALVKDYGIRFVNLSLGNAPEFVFSGTVRIRG